MSKKKNKRKNRRPACPVNHPPGELCWDRVTDMNFMGGTMHGVPVIVVGVHDCSQSAFDRVVIPSLDAVFDGHVECLGCGQSNHISHDGDFVAWAVSYFTRASA